MYRSSDITCIFILFPNIRVWSYGIHQMSSTFRVFKNTLFQKRSFLPEKRSIMTLKRGLTGAEELELWEAGGETLIHQLNAKLKVGHRGKGLSRVFHHCRAHQAQLLKRYSVTSWVFFEGLWDQTSIFVCTLRFKIFWEKLIVVLWPFELLSYINKIPFINLPYVLRRRFGTSNNTYRKPLLKYISSDFSNTGRNQRMSEKGF